MYRAMYHVPCQCTVAMHHAMHHAMHRALQVVGVALLVAMAFLKDTVVGGKEDEINQPMLALLVIIYLLRRRALLSCIHLLHASRYS